MALRKQPRSIARELALLSISQIKTRKSKLPREELGNFVLAAIRTLTIEVQDNLEAAAAEIKRGEERLLNSETRANDLNSAKVMLQEALELSQTAVNRLGVAIEFPEFLQLTSKEQVREYAIDLILTVHQHRAEIEQGISDVLVGWQLSRLPKVDRDILRIAVAEMRYLEIPERVAINESVELAKRYSDEDGFRFINGVLRRLSDRQKQSDSSPPDATDNSEPELTTSSEITNEVMEASTPQSEAPSSPVDQPNPEPKPRKVLPIIRQTASNQE